jgi:hypothetical protein
VIRITDIRLRSIGAASLAWPPQHFGRAVCLGAVGPIAWRVLRSRLIFCWEFFRITVSEISPEIWFWWTGRARTCSHAVVSADGETSVALATAGRLESKALQIDQPDAMLIIFDHRPSAWRPHQNIRGIRERLWRGQGRTSASAARKCLARIRHGFVTPLANSPATAFHDQSNE